jgi:hypothetical protein
MIGGTDTGHMALETALAAESRPISEERFAELVHAHAGHKTLRDTKNTQAWLDRMMPHALKRINGGR